MRLSLLLIFVLFGYNESQLQADDTTGTSSPRFPAPYSDYQIVAGSISHDEKFAAILRDISQGAEPSKNYLITLSTFRVVVELPTDAIFCDGSRSGGLNVNWSKDNTAAVIVQEGKFGPEKIYVLKLANDKVTETTDILAVLDQIVAPDFKKSGADSFNENFDFFIDEDNSWFFNDSNQIPLDCEFTNDPRLSAEKPWTGRLSGIWDVKEGRLLNPKFTRSSTTH
jgi:hypothetical protein